MPDAFKTSLPTDGELVDFTDLIQGHVGQSVKQEFTIERHRVIQNPKLFLIAREYIVKDQFGNVYVVITSKLIDDEVYAVTHWVKKSMQRRYGGFTDALLQHFQEDGWVAFGRATVEILKGRHAAGLPLHGSVDGFTGKVIPLAV